MIFENPPESQGFDDLRRINFWGTILVFLGVLHALVPGLSDQGWGLPLLAAGLLCLYFKASFGFVLAAAGLAVVGFSELFSKDLGFKNLIGLVLIYISVFPFQDVLRIFFNDQGDADLQIDPQHSRVVRLLPKVGLALSTFGLFGYVIVMFSMAVALGSMFGQSMAINLSKGVVGTFYNISPLITCCHADGILFGAGLLGGVLSLFSLIVKQTPRWMAWTGGVCSGLLLGFDLFVLPNFREIFFAIGVWS